jgi:hypothetical protein
MSVSVQGTVCLLVVLAISACSQRVEMPANRSTISGTYRLQTIGGEAVERENGLAPCSNRPFFSRYILTQFTWESVDSVMHPCGLSHPSGVISRGTFRLRADTIDFYDADTREGQQGLVDRGLFHHDTLVVSGSDEDGGDYRYVKQ